MSGFVPVWICKRAVAWRTAIGFGGPLLLGLVGSLLLRHPPLFVVGLFLALLGSLVGLWIGSSIGRRRSQPVRLKQYSPRKGTVAIRFRRAGYLRHLFKAMQVHEEVTAE